MFYHFGTVSDGAEKKVRVNGKWWPKNTAVNYPSELKDFKKSTMVCRTGREKWELLEDRVAMGVSTPIKPHWQVEKCCVFALPKRYLEEGNEDTAFFASIPALNNCATMSKKQRTTFRRGVEEVAEKDGARARLLQALGSDAKSRERFDAKSNERFDERSSESEGEGESKSQGFIAC